MRPAARTTALPLFVIGVSLSACTPAATPDTFHQQESGRVMQVQFGKVIEVRGVEIRPGQTRLGTITGAALGGIAGSQLGGNTAGSLAGGIGGAVAGGAIGSAIQGSRRTQGVELTIELDSGEMVAIVQPGDPRHFRVYDRVRLTGSAENARVTR